MSSALGLPLGTLLGQAVGWRGSFAAVVAAGAVVLVLAIVVLPSVPTARDSGAVGQARHAFAPRVIAVLGGELPDLRGHAVGDRRTCVPFLHQVTGCLGADRVRVPARVRRRHRDRLVRRRPIRRHERLARPDRRGDRRDGVARSPCSSSDRIRGSMALAVLGIGLFGMGTGPSIQYRVVSLAGPGAPLASALPASAVNAGIAFGAFAGGHRDRRRWCPVRRDHRQSPSPWRRSPPHGRPVS